MQLPRGRSSQAIRLDGDRVGQARKKLKPVYIALSKPVGITCTTERHVAGNIVDFVNHSERVFPIGRLDKDSEGLILLTNDGDIVNEVLRAEHNHEKEYVVRVDHAIYPASPTCSCIASAALRAPVAAGSRSACCIHRMAGSWTICGRAGSLGSRARGSRRSRCSNRHHPRWSRSRARAGATIGCGRATSSVR